MDLMKVMIFVTIEIILMYWWVIILTGIIIILVVTSYTSNKCPLCNSKKDDNAKVCKVCGIPFNNEYKNANQFSKRVSQKKKIETTKQINKEIKSQNITKEKSIAPTLLVYQKQEKPIITEKPKKKCPKCGAGNGLDAKYCMICNTEFKNNK